MRLAWVLLLLLSACVTTGEPPSLTGEPGPAQASKLGQSLELKRYPDQATWRLAEEKGNVVLLDVWATWCDPCRESLPVYQDLQNQFAAQGLRVYAINVDAQPAVIAPFLAESKLSLPVLLDPEARAAERSLRVKVMPTAFLFDRQGVLRHTHEGWDEAQLSTWIAEIEHLLSEPAQ